MNKMQKIFKGLLIYNGIVIVICLLFLWFAINRLTVWDFLFLAIPGILFTSISIIIGSVFKGKINTSGIIGILIWIAAQTSYIIWMVETME